MRRALSQSRAQHSSAFFRTHVAFKVLGLTGSLTLIAPGSDFGPTRALAWVESVPPLQHPELYPGLQPVLEFEGKVVHNCGNMLVNITSFGLIGSTPGEALYRWSSAPSLQWPAGSGTEYLYAAALWVGAVKGEEKAVTTGAFPFECLPGLTPIQRITRRAKARRAGLAHRRQTPTMTAMGASTRTC